MSSENRSSVKGAMQLAFGAAFVLAFGLTAWLLLRDLTASATVAAVLTLSMGLFCFLPILESFTAFGLSAQFRKRIDEADELLSQLRDQAILNGRIQVGTIASANRFTTGGYGQKMQQVELVIASLRKFGVPSDEIDDICKPYVRNITYDAARAYYAAMAEVAHQAITDLGVPINQARHENDVAGLAELELRVTALQAAVGENLRDLDGDQILAFMENEREALEGRDERDFSRETKLRLEGLRQEAVRVIQDTRARGNITREGNAFLIRQRAA